jgi:tripartite ATP-independent transporter DctP family solute receptor
MKRLALVALVALAIAAPGGSIAADAAIRFSTAAPPTDFLAKALDQFKTAVEAANTGVKVETYPGSVLFRQGTEVPALQRGNLEMSTMTSFEVAQQLPEYGLFNRAYLLRDYAHLRHVFDGAIGAAYRQRVADKMGIEILAVAFLGTRQVNLRVKRAVGAPEDLAGIKLRMPAGPEWLLLGKTLGVSPVPLGMPEVYLALKTGTIDGQENPLTIMSAAKLYEVTEQVVMTAHLIQPVFFAVAKPFWDKLAPEQRRVVEAAARAAAKANDDARLADETSVADAVKAKGLTVTTLDTSPFRALANKVYGESDLAKTWDQALAKRVMDTP